MRFSISGLLPFLPLWAICAARGSSPGLTGPDVFGVRPGSPLVHTFTATGQRPIVFSAQGLPPGIVLDPSTGRLSGRLAEPGEWRIRLTAANAAGSDTRTFRIKVGEAIALTPPMGWNSWNCWGASIDQQKILRAGRALVASGLADHGWTYINIDDGWQGERTGRGHALQGNARFSDPAALCGALHALGLKIGLYSTPWETSYAGFPGGSSDRADGQGSRNLTGTAQHRFGSHSFAAADARQWAEWGIDYLKYDWRPIDLAHVAEMSRALRATGRDIVFSLSNAAALDEAPEWARWANCWRTTLDVREHWALPSAPRQLGISESGFAQDRWAAFAGPGHWNDPDMLVVGEVGLGGPNASDVTGDEARTQITLWSLLSAPLLIGCDLEKLDASTLELLSNDEVIAVDQDPLGRQAIRVATCGPVDVYAKPLEDGGWALGFFNRDSAAQHFDYGKLGGLGFADSFRVRDLWRHRDLPAGPGSTAPVLPVRLPPHGAQLFKLSPAGPGSPRS